MAGFDDIKDKSLLSGKGAELLKARQERISNKSVQEVRILEKMAQDLADIDKLTGNLDEAFDKKLAEISRLSHRVEEMKKAVAQAEKGRAHGADKTFRQAATTMTGSSATLSDIAAASRASTNLGPALSMAQNQSTATLEDYISSRKSLLSRQNDRIRETSHNVDGNEGQLISQMGVRDRLVSQIGQASAAMVAQKKLGIDTQSSYYSAEKMTQHVRADQEQNSIRSGVASGQFGGRKQVEEQLDAIGKKLIATFENLDRAVKSTNDAEKAKADELSKQFNSIEKDYKRQQGILGEMNRNGGGGGGGSGLQMAGGIISNMGTVAMGVGQGMRYSGVTSNMAQVQNRIGLAGFAGERFQDAYGATQGDMGALRRVVGDQYSQQVKRGFQYSDREDTAKAIETGGSGARMVGSAIDGAVSVGGVWSGVKGGIAGGGAGAIAGVASEGLAKATPDALAFNQNLNDYSKQITQQQTFLQAAGQRRALQDALAKVDDFSGQAVFDRQRGLTTGTRGLGVGSVSEGSSGGQGLFHPTGGVGRISSGFGHRDHPVTGEKNKFHNGIDIAASAGSPLYAVGEGTVTESGYNSISGNYLRMQHDGKQFGYAHMRMKSTFQAGDKLERGQAIGEVGSTGRSTGAHLHLTARNEKGLAFDPTSMLSGTSTKGSGDRQNLQSLLSDPGVVDMIAHQAGLGGSDVNRLTGAGVSGLGKEFGREGGKGGVNDIVRSGQLSRIGYMQSPDQYMQARSSMTGSGGGAEDFEEILKNAVANGMDASKNIMEMVNATSTLAGRSAGAGIAAFGGAAEGLGRGIDMLRGTGVSTNMATAAAARAAGVAEDVSGSKDLDIANVIETARLRKDFGKASLQQLESMRTASPAELSQLEKLYRGGKTAQAEEMTIKMGLYGQVNNADDVSKIQRASREQVIRRATGYGIDREKEEALINKDEKDLTAAERSFMNGMTRGNTSRDVSGDAIRGYVDNRRGASKGTLATDPGGVVASGEDTMRAGATADSKVYAAGMDNLNKAVGGLEALGTTMMNISKTLDPTEFSQSIKDAALKFDVPTAAFGRHVVRFENAISDLSKLLRGANGKGPNLNSQVNPNQVRK